MHLSLMSGKSPLPGSYKKTKPERPLNPSTFSADVSRQSTRYYVYCYLHMVTSGTEHLTQTASQPELQGRTEPVGERSAPMVHEEPTVPHKLDITTTDFHPPKGLTAIAYRRLSILMSVDKLEKLREPYAGDEEVPAAIASEIARQCRELKRLPSEEIANKTLEKLNKKLQDILNPPQVPQDADPVQEEEELDDFLDDFEEDVEEEEEEDLEDDEESDEEEDEATTPPPVEDEAPVERKHLDLSDLDHLQIDVLQWGIKQSCLFLERNQLTETLLEAGARCMQDERLYKILDHYDCKPQTLFGWTAYHGTLDSFRAACQIKSQHFDEQLRALINPKNKKKTTPEELAIREEIKRLNDLQTAINNEIKDITRDMVEEFWRLYTEAAVILADQKVAGNDEVHIRAFLRYGMIGQAPWLLSKEVSDFLLDECAYPKRQWDYHVDATHVLYTDEYIHMVGQGIITPAMDEDLELNQKGSDNWKVDKLWRRLIYGKIIESSYNQTVDTLRAEIEKVGQEQTELEIKIEKLNPEKSTYKQKKKEMQEQIQNCKVSVARLQKSIEHINGKLLPDELAATGEAQSRIGGLPPMTAEILARREAKGIRKGCKLCAKLKEPYLPFILREKYKPGGAINDRLTVNAQINEIEMLDPLIFKDTIVQAKKASNRVYLRSCPYIILTPALGQMGFSLNPRGGPDVGRLLVPVLNARPGQLDRMCFDIFSDFRYDTSKMSAGVDLLTSDTLVAAYANARWAYRKKSKEIREKAAMFNEENDRNNWRRHYLLYMTSAMDGGKKLFFKCNEVYEAVIKYMQLPDGVERLQSN